MHTYCTAARVFHLRLPARCNNVTVQLGTGYRLPLSRQRAVIHGTMQFGQRRHRGPTARLQCRSVCVGTAFREPALPIGQFERYVRLVRAFRGDPAARNFPSPHGNKRTPRFAWRSTRRQALLERRERSPRRSTPEPCLKVRPRVAGPLPHFFCATIAWETNLRPLPSPFVRKAILGSAGLQASVQGIYFGSPRGLQSARVSDFRLFQQGA